MKKALILAVFSLLVAETTWARCPYKCTYSQDCYYCGQGGRLESCSVDCNVCWGLGCIAGGSLAACEEVLSFGAEPVSNPEPITALVRFPTDELSRATHPGIALALSGFWRWHDAFFKPGREVLNMEGGVAVDGKPYETRMEVRQQEGVQIYALTVEGFAHLLIKVKLPVDGRQELEFHCKLAAEQRTREGLLMLEAN